MADITEFFIFKITINDEKMNLMGSVFRLFTNNNYLVSIPEQLS